MLVDSAVTFQITRDPALLEDYYRLRSNLYHRHFPSLPPTFGQEEPDDLRGDILVATLAGLVVGGARISYVRPGEFARLPLESDAFRLATAFPEWNLSALTICEFSRHAVAPEYGPSISRALATEMAFTAKQRGAVLAFTVCPRGQTVLNRRHCRGLGLEFEVLEGVNPPNPFELSMALCVYRGLSNLRREV
jgi:hypothetical protein